MLLKKLKISINTTLVKENVTHVIRLHLLLIARKRSFKVSDIKYNTMFVLPEVIFWQDMHFSIKSANESKFNIYLILCTISYITCRCLAFFPI